MTRPFLTARWEQLVMLNYEVEPAILRASLPRGTELDCWQNRHYVSLVGFLFLDTRILGVPIPFHRHFEEVNLRFYVRRMEGAEVRRGVVFIKEVVAKRAVAAAARWIYHENYVRRPMAHQVRPPRGHCAGRIEYQWADLSLGAQYVGEPKRPDGESEAEFITEHYWGYTKLRDDTTLEYRVEHLAWHVWPAATHWFTGDAAGFYGAEFGAALSRPPASAFVVEGSPVAVHRGRRI